MSPTNHLGVGYVVKKKFDNFSLLPPHINTTTFCLIVSLPSISTMSIFANSGTNFQIDDEQSLQSVPISEQDSNINASIDSGSDTESVGSSEKKKFKIKTKKRSNSSDDSLSDADSTTKKARKARTTKPNALEKYGFDPELTWSFPKLKKYLDDSGRTCVSLTPINAHFPHSETTDTDIGFVSTFRKGVKEESILIITKFEPDWIADSNFNSYIMSFAGKSSKSSRLVIIHSTAKAWGAKKVTEALSKIQNINDISPSNNTHTIHFNGPSQDDTQEAAHLLLEVGTNTQIKPIPQAKTIQKSLPDSIDFNTEFNNLTNQFQAQMLAAQKSYQDSLSLLMASVSQSTSC